MMLTMSKCLPAALLMAAITPTQAGQFSLGAAAVHQTHEFHGQKDQTLVVPAIMYQGERFSFVFDTAAWTIAGAGPGDTGWQARALATPRFFDQPGRAEGLEKRKSTLEAGFDVEVYGGWGGLTVEALADTLGKHKGFQASVGYEYELTVSERFALTPSASITYQDKKLANYYYGVRPGEARAGRPAYRPGQSGTFGVGLLATYQLSERWMLMGMVEQEWLSDELADSPLIENDSSAMALIGVLYHF